MHKHGIHYSQCWEDPQVLLEALQPGQGDTILSITSGGDNTLALLASGAEKIVSIDLSPAQSYLLELKRLAIESLSHEEALAFLGVHASDERLKTYEKISGALSADARAWWSARPELISYGVIHTGRFDRFVSFFARQVIPLVHSKRVIMQLLSFESIEQQEQFYRERWDTLFWRMLFSLATNRLTLRRARQDIMTTHMKTVGTGARYVERLQRLLSTRTTKGNYFLQYSLTGNYTDSLPPYLEEGFPERLAKQRREALEILSGSLSDYLESIPDNSFSVFNLSDIFEALRDEEYKRLWTQLVRTARPNARIAYWTNLVERSIPVVSAHEDEIRSRALHTKDRVFFYGGFHVVTIQK